MIAPYFFTLLYIMAMIRPIAPLASFVINQDYIAEFFCVNQDRPELECNGKCYLMQRLEEQNEKKRQNLPPIAMEEYPIGFVKFIALDIPKKERKTNSIFIDNRNNYHFIYSDSSFRPPTHLGEPLFL